MTRRKLHFRNFAGMPDTPMCNPEAADCLTTDRAKEVECVRCQKLLEAEVPSQKLMRAQLKTLYQNAS